MEPHLEGVLNKFLIFQDKLTSACFYLQEMENVKQDFDLQWVEGSFPGWPVSLFVNIFI
jgi:hypothetical protein